MTAQGGNILAWLDSTIRHREYLACLTENESGTAWREDPFVYGVRDQTNALAIRARENRTTVLAHIAANDPESVLRRCAADRKLIELHARCMHSCPAKDETDYLDEWTQFGYEDACPVVQLIAEGYGWTEDAR